jgi:hypothetical protein
MHEREELEQIYRHVGSRIDDREADVEIPQPKPEEAASTTLPLLPSLSQRAARELARELNRSLAGFPSGCCGFPSRPCVFAARLHEILAVASCGYSLLGGGRSKPRGASVALPRSIPTNPSAAVIVTTVTFRFLKVIRGEGFARRGEMHDGEQPRGSDLGGA